MSSLVTYVGRRQKLPHKEFIFEGAQGLGLDQLHGQFPYVTRSYTGLRNVQFLAHTLGCDDIRAIYVTRPYLTRHGPGPFRASVRIPFNVVDKTNVENPWQGQFRIGELGAHEMDAMGQRIRNDLRLYGKNVKPAVAISCLDQAWNSFSRNGVVDGIKSLGLDVVITRYGTSREQSEYKHD